MARASAFESKLDLMMWGEVSSLSNWLWNSVLDNQINLQVSYKIQFNHPPNFRLVLKFEHPG